MAEAERVERGYLGTLLRLTLLAPGIVQAILDGNAPVELRLPRLLEPFPVSWVGRRAAFESAFARAGAVLVGSTPLGSKV